MQLIAKGYDSPGIRHETAIIMKIAFVAALGLWLLGATACSHDHDDGKVWSQEELDELERKWGFEVRPLLHFAYLTERAD